MTFHLSEKIQKTNFASGRLGWSFGGPSLKTPEKSWKFPEKILCLQFKKIVGANRSFL
jgi:hypothetical protein